MNLTKTPFSKHEPIGGGGGILARRHLSKHLNSIITSWNKGAGRLFGYAAEEIVGKPVTILMPPFWFGWNQMPPVLHSEPHASLSSRDSFLFFRLFPRQLSFAILFDR